MGKCFRLFTALFALWTSSLAAYLHPCAGSFAFDGEFLYLLPSIDDTYFVIQSPVLTLFPNGTRKNNEIGFHPGFRVGGTYAFCGATTELQVYYARLRAKETETVTGNFLWATVGRSNLLSDFTNYSGSASSQLDVLYQRVDAILAQQAWSFKGWDLFFRGGAEFASARLQEDYQYQSAIRLGEVSAESKTWGIGPQFGVEIDYDSCDLKWYCPGALSFVAYTSGSLLASRTQGNVLNTVFTGGLENTLLNLIDDSTWRIIPVWHARVGLNYVMCFFSCFSTAFEVGYEFNTYIRALSRLIFPNSDDALSPSEYVNFDVQGLYASVILSF